jgi:hypothetical protein
MGLGLTPGNLLTIKPDDAITIVHRHLEYSPGVEFCYLICITAVKYGIPSYIAGL